MMKLYVWEGLPNNYPSKSAEDGLQRTATAVIIAPSVKVAIELVTAKIDPGDRFGPSAHYRRMAEGMKQIKPSRSQPITLPGSVGKAEVVLLSIGAHYLDPAASRA